MSEEEKNKTYKVSCNTKDDIRKQLFSKCAEENIVIMEMKKEEISLEEAFIKIIDNTKKDAIQEGGENK